MENKVIFCECQSPEHQIIFFYDKEDDVIYMETHLSNSKSIWKRIISGIKYIFGYKSKFGNFDSLVLGFKQIKELDDVVNSYYNNHPEYSKKVF